MDNLEGLDDKTLRTKCLEYGLPNVPITDTSRKLLIKKLKVAMAGGEGKTTDKEKRRETIQVPAKSEKRSDERSKEKSMSPSRRRTVDPNIIPSVKLTPTPAPITQRRRSGRVTPGMQSETIIPEETKTKIAATAIREEPEDVIVIDDEVPAKHSRPPSRQSRSSLTPTPAITISYSPQEKTAEPIYEEEEEEQVYSSNIGFNKHNIMYEYEATNTAYMPLNYKQQEFSLYPSLKEMASQQILTAAAPPVLSTSRRHTNIGGGSYGQQQDNYKLSSKRGRSYSATMEDEEDSGSGDDIVKDSTYLSDFTRKLTRLKADPFDSGMSTFKSEVTSYNRELPTKYGSRFNDSRFNQQKSGSVGESFKQLLVVMDKKYGLKSKCYIVLGIMILVIFYIYFS